MERLRIRLFGPLEVWAGKRVLSGFPPQRARSLFAFLALHHDRFFPRDFLRGTFWGHQSERVLRKRLRTSLWRMRRLVAPEGTEWPDPIVVRDHVIGFDPSEGWWLDVRECERRPEDRLRAAREGLAEAARSRDTGAECS